MNLDISNVKTVKEQTFHKCFTMFHKRSDHLTGMKPKCLSLFLNLPHRKRSFLFGPGEHILDQIESICYQQDKFEIWERYQNVLVSFPNGYWNVCPFVFDITNLDSAATPGLTSIDLYPVPPSPGSSYISC